MRYMIFLTHNFTLFLPWLFMSVARMTEISGVGFAQLLGQKFRVLELKTQSQKDSLIKIIIFINKLVTMFETFL